LIDIPYRQPTERGTEMTTTEKTHLQRLQEQENAIFARRDEAEGEVNKVVGRELSPLEFLQIRQAIGTFEECESKIEGVQLRIEDVRRWVD
jgi:hypothetical protein